MMSPSLGDGNRRIMTVEKIGKTIENRDPYTGTYRQSLRVKKRAHYSRL